MYVIEAEITNLRSIPKVSWTIPAEQAAGWHVVLGDNGAGKSSFLRGLSLALVGHENAQALRQPWENWVRRGESEAAVSLRLQRDEAFDRLPKGKRLSKKAIPTVDFYIEKVEGSEPASFTVSSEISFPRGQGWFSAAYGPFRRFTGSDKEYETVFISYPRLARHLSIFDERVALTECLDWLRQLRFQQLEGGGDGALLESLKTFINQEDFLPFGARLHEISSKQVSFVDGNGCEVRIEEMSDGYRSILSMTFELLRQLASEYGPQMLFSANDPTRVAVPGVVLVDEIDAHLHPTWQRRVGLWFRRHFPKMQFIVTTHSPLVCQAADVGTVFRLPQPGSTEQAGMVSGQDLERLLYGDILDAYGTGIFGRGITRSPSSQDRLERLAQLNLKEIHEGLSEEEMADQQNLRATLPTAAHVLKASDAADS